MSYAGFHGVFSSCTEKLINLKSEEIEYSTSVEVTTNDVNLDYIYLKLREDIVHINENIVAHIGGVLGGKPLSDDVQLNKYSDKVEIIIYLLVRYLFILIKYHRESASNLMRNFIDVLISKMLDHASAAQCTAHFIFIFTYLLKGFETYTQISEYADLFKNLITALNSVVVYYDDFPFIFGPRFLNTLIADVNLEFTDARFHKVPKTKPTHIANLTLNDTWIANHQIMGSNAYLELNNIVEAEYIGIIVTIEYKVLAIQPTHIMLSGPGNVSSTLSKNDIDHAFLRYTKVGLSSKVDPIKKEIIQRVVDDDDADDDISETDGQLKDDLMQLLNNDENKDDDAESGSIKILTPEQVKKDDLDKVSKHPAYPAQIIEVLGYTMSKISGLPHLESSVSVPTFQLNILGVNSDGTKRTLYISDLNRDLVSHVLVNKYVQELTPDSKMTASYLESIVNRLHSENISSMKSNPRFKAVSTFLSCGSRGGRVHSNDEIIKLINRYDNLWVDWSDKSETISPLSLSLNFKFWSALYNNAC